MTGYGRENINELWVLVGHDVAVAEAGWWWSGFRASWVLAPCPLPIYHPTTADADG